tara:strand:+ start:43 stop:1173 length:1131 start_codon:yes stop_codon:yes gene_type:complete
MDKIYTALGLMSGTSMDGVDTSIIQTDGKHEYKAILDKYFEYPKNIYKNLTTLRDKIKSSKDLKKYQKQIKSVEKEVTIFHAKVVNEILKKIKINVDFIGFHGQTIFHNAKEKITKQLGDGKLLSKLTKKKVIYDFRQNDLKNGGQGAPLTPVFHQVLAKKFDLIPAYFLNIGGITNYTLVLGSDSKKYHISANDIGPGMCLIDYWVRTNSKKKYDKNGKLAKSGKINTLLIDMESEHKTRLVEKKLTSGKKRISYDIKDFDASFVKNLSFKDAIATLTEFTVNELIPSLNFVENDGEIKLILCGGGRKNKFLRNRIKKFVTRCKLIDDYGIDGDFVESQAFGYLAIRSYLKLPISFPETTGCKKQCTGGEVVKNF